MDLKQCLSNDISETFPTNLYHAPRPEIQVSLRFLQVQDYKMVSTKWQSEKTILFSTSNQKTKINNFFLFQMLHQAFNEYWGPLAGFEEEQINSMNDGGYYTTLLRPGLRILSWNSNLG